jgi:hypothetical protein
MHGWCPPDSTVCDEAKTERAWSRMLTLFESAGMNGAGQGSQLMLPYLYSSYLLPEAPVWP